MLLVILSKVQGLEWLNSVSLLPNTDVSDLVQVLIFD